MYELGRTHRQREEHAPAKEWFTKAADAGLPQAMYALGTVIDKGEGVAGVPDYPAAAGWYERAADAGNGEAAVELAHMCLVGRGRALAQNACQVISTVFTLVS